MRISIYPGSFDPITYGHLDIIERSKNLCDKLIIAVARNSAKNSLFSIDERIDIIKNCCKSEYIEIEVVSFDGLLIDYCKKENISLIIRGLRSVTDYEYEKPIASINRKLDHDIETIFLMAKDETAFVSSYIVREIASYNGDISSLVPKSVLDRIQQKIS